jgi:hypothetical protein
MSSEEYLEGRAEAARLVNRTKIKLYWQGGAAGQLGKHLGMFDKDKANTPLDAIPEPRLPSRERLEEMRKRYAKPHLHAIERGKQE